MLRAHAAATSESGGDGGGGPAISRTDPQRRAIVGLSMGGWGALALGQKDKGCIHGWTLWNENVAEDLPGGS